MAFVKAHLKIKNSYKFDFTPQISLVPRPRPAFRRWLPSDCITSNLSTSKTNFFVEEHAHTAPRQCFKQLLPKTQNPRQNPIISKHEGTHFTQQTFL